MSNTQIGIDGALPYNSEKSRDKLNFAEFKKTQLMLMKVRLVNASVDDLHMAS